MKLKVFFLIFILFLVKDNNFVKSEYNEIKSNIKSNNDKPILKFKSDKTFKIIQFTDLHYGYGGYYDTMTLDSQISILEKEKPDFVMFSGDMISGNLLHFNQTKIYEYYWDLFTGPLVERKIPWAITMGNHDAEGLLKVDDLIEMDQSFEYSLTKRGPRNIPGAANYHLKIYSSNSTRNRHDNNSDIHQEEEQFSNNGNKENVDVSSFIYIFDSDSKKCDRLDWGCINNGQVQWFKNISNFNQKKNSISFVHVPPIEVIDLWNNHDEIEGSFDEPSCCFDDGNSHFVRALLDQGDIRGLYFGHDHKNDFHGNYKGMDMGYGRKSGFGSYSSKKPLGARIIQLNEDQQGKNFIKTWITESNGEVFIQKKPLKKKHYRHRCILKKSKYHISIFYFFFYFFFFYHFY
ncbi:hypothetical protein DICPUDRAFT_37481 [Dictyostelium purpureum]|uniref:Calcineurin-like phosphoesterase domain-containing protein n=1 Tax=Dictyostelium purpureum TaxID=5786 RepID=F0ZSW9_DICPU|nr:uncharacterized protein DICPUDRAFT_37481 [Dictyostelium purpureum]EGC32943.1 hypothetical protein DICPUDRAFT_37481 [Dictyostelium purpureum]|eukprot:XP_003290509.1 hypothetical protein DICPUDRAFT_37481 [Dictyostelium purpureum]